MKSIALPVGIVILCLALILGFGSNSFTVHMVVHMGIVAVAAPLIAHGLVGARRDPMARWTWMTPMLASLIELVVIWFWHLPVLRAAADASHPLTLIEQIGFLAAGLLLWIACLRPGEGRLAGTVGLLFTSMHMTLLGVLLALAPRPLYGDGAVRCFGISLPAAADQQIGGVVMLVVGAFAYLVGGIVLLAGVLRDGETLREGPRC
ncbi:cytochrome c oxidase assembly protein [Shinella sp. CPCC 101442]|uniref:cytochrome c oxidase assembly protein n=1 Tax=Shinella sp. CPCC 101442 TaxID=2932265 RepID=UPI002153650A|nr:cytochrome c oxidase assembly protein [Shinella sp. CPCC 101442]MCR6502003.1 cytochrome c oxidase assembly protein [Shinella sp. CPCC 101442]